MHSGGKGREQCVLQLDGPPTGGTRMRATLGGRSLTGVGDATEAHPSGRR